MSFITNKTWKDGGSFKILARFELEYSRVCLSLLMENVMKKMKKNSPRRRNEAPKVSFWPQNLFV